MFQTIKHVSFRIKLFIITLGIAFFSILLVSTALIAFDYYEYKQNFSNELESLTDIMALSLDESLVTENIDVAKRKLHELEKNEHILGSFILDSKNTVFLSHSEIASVQGTLNPSTISPQYLTFTSPIINKGITVGSLTVIADFKPLFHKRLKKKILLGLGIALLVMNVVFCMTSILLDIISRPVTQLVDTMYRFTSEQDYSIRAKKLGDDELGNITDNFNNMLSTMEAQHDELTKARKNLEERVRQRTEHMIEEVRTRTEAEHKAESYNQELKLEIDQRVEAEERMEAYFQELQESNKSLKAAIEQANSLAFEAQTANASKSDFLANMSHEIRTPMNAILGFISFILETELSEEQYGFANSVQKASNHLMELINEILDFSKIDAGKLELEQIPFDLRIVTEDAIDTMHIRAFEKGLNIACMIHGDFPHTLVGDPGRLRQVIINLVGNAIKFTQEGEVVLHIALDEYIDGEESLVLDFAIADTGLGIPQEKQEALFDAFSQIDTSTTREYGGTGLGLTISKRIVSMMKGEIGVSSEVGKGSTFWFTAQFKTQQKHPETNKPFPIDMTDKRVLTFSRDTTTSELLHLHMDTWGIKHNPALDSESATNLLRSSIENGSPYDLVILDTEQLGDNSSSLVHELTTNSDLSALPVIILTYIGSQDYPQGLNQLPRAVYLNKPIRQAHLLDAMVKVLTNDTKELTTSTRPKKTAKTALYLGTSRILLVEDNPMNQEVARHILTSMGCHVTIACNGQEACDLTRDHHFDAILMDIQMPVMSGIDATMGIRAQENNTGSIKVPIIAMTAHTMKGQQELYLNSGMDDYISKPINKERLHHILENWLSLPTSPHAPIAKESPSSAMKSPVDLSRLKYIADNNEKILNRLLKLFLVDVIEFAPKIQQSVKNNDGEGLSHAAHRIKGGAGQVGAHNLHTVCSALELLGRENNFKKAAVSLDEFNQEYKRVVDFLEQTIQS